LRGDNTWATPASGGTPAGSSGQFQLNNAGAFGTGILTLGGAQTEVNFVQSGHANNGRGILNLDFTYTALGGSTVFTANGPGGKWMEIVTPVTAATAVVEVYNKFAGANYAPALKMDLGQKVILNRTSGDYINCLVAGTLTTGSIISAAGFVGPLTGNASTATSASGAVNATNASNATVTADATNVSRYLVFGPNSTTGNEGLLTTSALDYNPWSGTLTVNGLQSGVAPMVVRAASGQLVAIQAWYVGSSNKGYIDASGNWNGLDFIASSDLRLKDDIVTIPNALSRVLALRGATFTRVDDDTNRRHMGLIAQEVEPIVPEVVSTDEHGMKSVSYGSLVGILIEAIKDFKAEMDLLKSELRAMREAGQANPTSGTNVS
jgi:hypothetical protein